MSYLQKWRKCLGHRISIKSSKTQVAVTISKSTPFFKKTKFISFLLYLKKKKNSYACYTLRNEGDIFITREIEFTFAWEYVKQKYFLCIYFTNAGDDWKTCWASRSGAVFKERPVVKECPPFKCPNPLPTLWPFHIYHQSNEFSHRLFNANVQLKPSAVQVNVLSATGHVSIRTLWFTLSLPPIRCIHLWSSVEWTMDVRRP